MLDIEALKEKAFEKKKNQFFLKWIGLCEEMRCVVVTCQKRGWSHVKCRVTEYMNGSSVHEWFLNNYEMIRYE